MVVSDILPMSHAEYNEQLFRSAAFSDCTIKCQNRLWHLHRAILSPRCEFFWKCFDGPWAEELSATILMHDDDPDTLDRLLRWIYTLEWPRAIKRKQGYADGAIPEIWTADLMLYVMADKYGLSALQDQAREALLRTADTCFAIYRESDSKTFITNLDDFIEMLYCLFNDLPDDRDDILGLRHDILFTLGPMIAKHMRNQTKLAELVTTIPEFSIELIEALARPSRDKEYAGDAFALHAFMMDGRADSCQSSTNGGSRDGSPKKVHIPMNEESEDEFELS